MNRLYKKRKRQYSLDNGVTWVDFSPNVYSVGDLLDSESSCSGEDSKQYRWVLVPIEEQYDCDMATHVKYQIAKKQYSLDGVNWYDVIPYDYMRSGTTIPNSVDCGWVDPSLYEYDWFEDGSFICEEEETRCDVILYNSIGDVVVEPYNYNAFGANVLSNTYSAGQGEITFDGCVTSIGDYAFNRCNSLTSVIIPDSVTSIGNAAFQVCESLTNVTIPSSVTSIGGYAFYFCTSLTSVTIPDSVRSIGDIAFYECSGLASVTIGSGVTSIGQQAFQGCSGLTSIEIPNSVTSIGNYAFASCESLTNVTIPSSVTTIDEGTFGVCSSLTSVTIPNSVTSIGEYAFYGCSSLTSVNYNGTKAQWNAITKGTDWKYNVPTTCQVHCTDGDINI